MEWLNKVSKYHDDYVRIVRSYGETVYAEDIVQEMYLRLHKYGDPNKIIKPNGEVNKPYIFWTLKNIFRSLCLERKKHQKVDLNEMKHITVEFDYISKNDGEEIMEQKIQQEIESWHWYDQKLFKLYRDKGWSYREAAKQTKIGCKSIFLTIKHCKDRIRENLSEDYEDYINGDYEKLKK